jgi:hypothetical protein
MTQILRSKLVKKTLLLVILTLTLAYLRTPGEMLAQGCVEDCVTEYFACKANCHGNQTCITECGNQENQCVDGCD